MTEDHEIAHRPLPAVLKPVADELLSSWLVRHAAYYGVTASFFTNDIRRGTDRLRRSTNKPIGWRAMKFQRFAMTPTVAELLARKQRLLERRRVECD